MKLFIDSSVVNGFCLDHWCSHSCLQESSAQYHPEESPRLPVSFTLLNSDPLSCCHAVSLFWTHLRQMSFLTCFGLSFFPHPQQNQVHQWDHFPYHVRQRGEDSVQRDSNASRFKIYTNLQLSVSSVDGDYRWWISLPDEDAAPHHHNCVKLLLANRGHVHLATAYSGLVLPTPPKEGRNCRGVKYQSTHELCATHWQ